MISDLRQHLSVNVLKRQTAVTDHLAGLLQANRPQAETIIRISLHVSLDPAHHAGIVKNIRIVLHDVRIRQYVVQRFKIIHRHFAEIKPLRFQNLFHSNLFDFCPTLRPSSLQPSPVPFSRHLFSKRS